MSSNENKIKIKEHNFLLSAKETQGIKCQRLFTFYDKYMYISIIAKSKFKQ